MTIVFVGPPASGKTTLGRALAARLGLEFVDVDQVIEDRAAKTIAEIFVDEGEAHFRGLERDTTLELLGPPDEPAKRVLSLGGGAVMDDQIRDALAGHDVIWLQVSVTHATRRVGMNVMRPLVLGDVRANLERLQAEREPLYREVARHEIDTTDRRPEALVDAILELLGGSR
ncbi:shikimate kinase [Aestuariimicrobium sp. T2.26MG-19.2B]|uniref:shikimate kinase n=1 Tax=Aestuariimicrobium sp. T2.26MG-19.2B TaxID=3040679 RepID=UPI0024775D05|nr:shikimate kinase [Aestuariimicrobium sp. T2.26MG-19.2B]CAI9410003.1 Shikimate kinase [Aestuariimicrobium sp. T2.26MG-19.2B]